MRGPRAPEYIRKLGVYVPGKPIEEVQRELGVDDIVKLASNENPLGPSPKALAAIQRALPNLHRYPDGSGWALRNVLAGRLGVDIAQVILGSGSVEIIEMVARAFLADGDEAVFSQQSFISYRLAVSQVNGRAVTPPATPGRAHDLPALAGAVTERTKVVYLANPCNPTGTYFTRRQLDRFLSEVDGRALIVVDQAYHEYVGAADYPDALDDVKAGRSVMVLRTFSKVYGLAGLRVGFGVSSPGVMETVNRVRSPFNTSSLAQAAAMAALQDDEWVGRSREHNAKELQFLQTELARRGLGFTPSVANFVLVEFEADVDDLFLEFQRRGVIIRPVGGPGLVNCARVSVGTHSENERFLAAVDQLTLTRNRA